MASKDPVKEAQGVLIRQKMAQVGLKQSELALKCGVTQAAISKVVSGDRSPSPELLTKIATALGSRSRSSSREESLDRLLSLPSRRRRSCSQRA